MLRCWLIHPEFVLSRTRYCYIILLYLSCGRIQTNSGLQCYDVFVNGPHSVLETSGVTFNLENVKTVFKCVKKKYIYGYIRD